MLIKTFLLIGALVFAGALDANIEQVGEDKQMMNCAMEKQEKRYVIGVEIRTSNAEFLKIVQGQWDRFYSEKDKIPNKIGAAVFVLYTDYESDYTKPYSFVIGCEVSTLDSIPKGMVGKVIPEANYAVFTAEGEYPQSVGNAWQKIWTSNLSRAYATDFQVYPPDFHLQTNPAVKIYVSLQAPAATTPKYLYKILSLPNWQASQGAQNLKLSDDDTCFVHFSMQDQLDRILAKYWSKEDCIVLKIDANKLQGKMVFEVNPGGSTKYYHLYDGSVPLESVAEHKIVSRN